MRTTSTRAVPAPTMKPGCSSWQFSMSPRATLRRSRTTSSETSATATPGGKTGWPVEASKPRNSTASNGHPNAADKQDTLIPYDIGTSAYRRHRAHLAGGTGGAARGARLSERRA